MRQKEQKLYDTMKKNKPQHVWLQRIENVVGEGMPDVHVSAVGVQECWVELKAVHCPALMATRLLGNEGLRQSQINWHLKAKTKNIRSYILIRDDSGVLYLVEGKYAAELNQLNVVYMRRKFAVDSWDSIYKVLLGWEE